MPLIIHFPTTVNALRRVWIPLESILIQKMGQDTSFDLERFSIGVANSHTAFLNGGYNPTFIISQNSQNRAKINTQNPTQYAILTNMQENTEANKLEEIIDLIQTERRYLNNILADVCTMPQGVEPVFVENLEDLVRVVGNMNAAFEHAKAMQTLDDPGDRKMGLFCLLKHLATALVQIEEVGLSTRMIYQIIKEVSGGRIKACGACEDDSEAAHAIEHDGGEWGPWTDSDTIDKVVESLNNDVKLSKEGK